MHKRNRTLSRCRIQGLAAPTVAGGGRACKGPQSRGRIFFENIEKKFNRYNSFALPRGAARKILRRDRKITKHGTETLRTFQNSSQCYMTRQCSSDTVYCIVDLCKIRRTKDPQNVYPNVALVRSCGTNEKRPSKPNPRSPNFYPRDLDFRPFDQNYCHIRVHQACVLKSVYPICTLVSILFIPLQHAMHHECRARYYFTNFVRLSLCLSVRLTNADTASKRMDISSHFFIF